MNWVEDKWMCTVVYVAIYILSKGIKLCTSTRHILCLCLYNFVYAVNKFTRKHAPLINQFFFVQYKVRTQSLCSTSNFARGLFIVAKWNILEDPTEMLMEYFFIFSTYQLCCSREIVSWFYSYNISSYGTSI